MQRIAQIEIALGEEGQTIQPRASFKSLGAA
jgi:hypothetical protein